MTIKWFKSPFGCVIFLLTQTQVANQQKKTYNPISVHKTVKIRDRLETIIIKLGHCSGC